MKSLFSSALLLLILFTISGATNAIYAQSQKSNKYIYFSSDKNTSGRDIVRINANGGSRIKLTNNNGRNHYPHHNGPVLSPDGSKIVYHSDTDGHDRYAIWTMNIDGSNKRRITQKEGLFANWSPNGKNIIFSGRRNGIWEIITIPSEGGEEMNLSKNFKKEKKPGWGANASYHPNGTSIIYSYIRENVLYSMDLKTKKIVQISPSNHNYTQPSFSKDGTKIAVNRRINKAEGYDLIIMSATGDNIQTIAKKIVSYSSPSWSQSGNELLFCGMVKGNQQLFKVNINSNEETQLTNNSSFNALATW